MSQRSPAVPDSEWLAVQVTERVDGQAVAATVRGRLDARTAPLLTALLTEAGPPLPGRTVMLVFDQVTVAGASGLFELAAVQRRFEAAGAGLLVTAPPQMLQLLRQAGIAVDEQPEQHDGPEGDASAPYRRGQAAIAEEPVGRT